MFASNLALGEGGGGGGYGAGLHARVGANKSLFD